MRACRTHLAELTGIGRVPLMAAEAAIEKRGQQLLVEAQKSGRARTSPQPQLPPDILKVMLALGSTKIQAAATDDRRFVHVMEVAGAGGDRRQHRQRRQSRRRRAAAGGDAGGRSKVHGGCRLKTGLQSSAIGCERDRRYARS
jgi:hypothetical protein